MSKNKHSAINKNFPDMQDMLDALIAIYKACDYTNSSENCKAISKQIIEKVTELKIKDILGE